MSEATSSAVGVECGATAVDAKHLVEGFRWLFGVELPFGRASTVRVFAALDVPVGRCFVDGLELAGPEDQLLKAALMTSTATRTAVPSRTSRPSNALTIPMPADQALGDRPSSLKALQRVSPDGLRKIPYTPSQSASSRC